MEIKTPQQARKLKGLIFSPWGHGKTVFLATAQDDPRSSPALFLDFEGGTDSIADREIDMVTCRNWQDFREVYEYLANEDHGYKSVLVDSITEVHQGALLQILQEEAHRRSDPDLIEIKDYGKAAVQMRKFIRTFRDLPCHVLFSALTKTDSGPEGDVYIPQLTGKLASEIPGMLDIVAYLAVTDEGQRVLILRNYPKFRTKIRVPPSAQIPDEIPDPTLSKVLDVLDYETYEAEAPTGGVVFDKEV